MKNITLILLMTVSIAFGNYIQLGSDINGEAAGDRSGSSVALSSDGSIVAIGAPYNDGNGSNSGHVRLYEWDGSSWNQLGSDIDGEASSDLSGSSVSLSADGSVVAIGADGNDGNGNRSGHVRLYQWDGSTWNQLGSDIDGEAASDYSGSSVALSSDGLIVAIGAERNDGNGDYSGHVRLYQWNGSSWNQLGSDIDGEAANDNSGYSVALSSDGSIVAIAAPASEIESNSGHVRLYQWDGLTWNKLGSDIDGEFDLFSQASVALNADGSIVAFGATNDNGTDSRVRVFNYLVDSDGDGLSDGDEVNIYSTDPNNADSDEDGLNDGYEVNTSLTDPNDSDSDEDGLSDGDEVTNGTNPLIADVRPVLNLDIFYEVQSGQSIVIDATPTDGYPTNFTYQWIQNGYPIPPHFGGTTNLYTFFSDNFYNGNWSVIVRNDTGSTTNSFVFEVFVDTDQDGLSDGRETYVTFTNPNVSDSDDDGLNDNYEVNTSNTDPNDSDSDDDGLSDGYEVNTSNTDPNGSDSDDDGLSDGYEVNTSYTNPNDSDSDDDGLSDGYEVNTSSTNPNNADSDGDGLNDGYEISTSATDPADSDSDDDGLSDGYEVNTSATDPSDSDSDNDGFNDGSEITLGLDPNANNDDIVNFIKNNPSVFNLSEGGMTMSEAQAAMRDLRVGSQTFGVSNGNAKIRMFVDESSDLTSTWSNTQHVLELDIPADSDTKFYRFRMD